MSVGSSAAAKPTRPRIPVYNLAHYGRMIADPVRREAYAEAIRSAVRPGSVVLETGTGPGVFALLAARHGARRTYALEPSDSIAVTRQLAVDNGLADRIDFRQGLSSELELPQRADVVISDLRGNLPLFQNHLASILDARRRLLAPGGVLIPQEDRLWVGGHSIEAIARQLQSAFPARFETRRLDPVQKS